MTFHEALSTFPLIAILRGVQPDEVVTIGGVLIEAGFRIIEVPLNSPNPFQSIENLSRAFPATLVGAGTVLTPEAVLQVRDAGGRLILMPHSDGAVVRAAKVANLAVVPGVATPTEAFAALQNGADALKMFPAEVMPPPVVKAWRSVLPINTYLLPVGGITPDKISGYLAAGASGFGLGSALYHPGDKPAAVAIKALQFAKELLTANQSRVEQCP